MAFEDKHKTFKDVLSKDLENKGKLTHAGSGRPLTGKERRQSRSYTMLPSVIEAIDKAASQGSYSSASNFVEQTMIEKLKKLNLHI